MGLYFLLLLQSKMVMVQWGCSVGYRIAKAFIQRLVSYYCMFISSHYYFSLIFVD